MNYHRANTNESDIITLVLCRIDEYLQFQKAITRKIKGKRFHPFDNSHNRKSLKIISFRRKTLKTYLIKIDNRMLILS